MKISKLNLGEKMDEFLMMKLKMKLKLRKYYLRRKEKS